MSYKSFFAFWAVLLFTMCNLGDQKKLYKYPDNSRLSFENGMPVCDTVHYFPKNVLASFFYVDGEKKYSEMMILNILNCYLK